MKSNQERELLLQLKNDINRSLRKTLTSMTRVEHKELSWFCSEERKVLAATKQAA